MVDEELLAALRTLSPLARELIRDVFNQDRADRNALAERLLRYRDERRTAWVDLVDRLSLDP